MGKSGPHRSEGGYAPSFPGSLPPGWRRLAAAPDLPCHVLGHPTQGVILLDLARHGSPGIEARLGRSMTRAGLRGTDGSTPPVWYVRIEPENMPRFALLLADAMASMPPPAQAAEAWLQRLETALARDPAWSPPPPLRRARPSMLVGGSLAAAILLALLLWQGQQAATRATGATMPLPAAEPVGTAPQPVPETRAAMLAPPAAPEPTTPVPAPAPHPVAAPRPQARPAARPVDPRCAQAQYRWQRGEPVTSAEMAYVRQGCGPAPR